MAAREFALLRIFEYRKNPDGTLVSICPNCFEVIANAGTTQEMAGREFLHTLQCGREKSPSANL